MKGCVQVYTGDGKGKTTAALGLIMRACGAGLKVYMGQFLKKRNCSEIKTLRKRFPCVAVEQYGRGCFVRGKPAAADFKAAEQGRRKLKKAMTSGKYDIVIADEINIAVSLRLLTVKQALDLIDDKPDNVELVFTGRNAPKAIIKRADLVTEMRNIRHYFNKGIVARRGIES